MRCRCASCCLCDYKSRCRLRTVAFWVKSFTTEADVQDRRVGRHVRNSPIKVCGLWVEYWRNAHGEGPAAIQRQPNFHFTSREISNRGQRILPLNADLLSRMENLASCRRNQRGGIVASRGSECTVLSNCGASAKATTNNVKRNL